LEKSQPERDWSTVSDIKSDSEIEIEAAAKPRRELVVELRKVPQEGAEIHAVLSDTGLHLEGEDSFVLLPGARFDGRVDRGDDESLHIVGTLQATVRLECGRCLDAFEHPAGANLDLYFLPDDGTELAEQDVELKERDMVVGSYTGGELDLGETLREHVHLSIPLKRLCRDECEGLCLTCGANRNHKTCACPERADADPRLAGLAHLFKRPSD
jgi:uncharacterized protein